MASGARLRRACRRIIASVFNCRSTAKERSLSEHGYCCKAKDLQASKSSITAEVPRTPQCIRVRNCNSGLQTQDQGLIDSTSKHEHVDSSTAKVLLDNHSQIDQLEHPPAQDKLPSTAADPTDTSGAAAVVHTRLNHPAGHEVQSTSASKNPTTNQRLAAVCSLAQPGTQEALQALLQAAWHAGQTIPASTLALHDAVAAAAVPHLLSLPNLLVRRAVPVNSLGRLVPSAQILQEAAEAYQKEPNPGFFQHLQSAARKASTEHQAGMYIDTELKAAAANSIDFNPHVPLSGTDEAVEVLAITSKPVRANLTHRFKHTEYTRAPSIRGLPYKKVLWAVHHIPTEHDEVIKILLRQGQSVMSTEGVLLLRQLAARFMSNIDSYHEEAAIISLPGFC